MTDLTEQHRACAERLLKGSANRPEDNIRQDIGRLLDAFDIDNLLTYQTDGGPADIYLPRRRVVIETKAVGLANEPDKPQARENNETPRDQMERYLRSELDAERGMLPFEHDQDLRWTGIVTDGKVWHAWYYDPNTGDVLQHCIDGFHPKTAEELLHRLLPLFNQKQVGKPLGPGQSAGTV